MSFRHVTDFAMFREACRTRSRDECWLWGGYRKNGYGSVNVTVSGVHKPQYVHRLMYEAERGRIGEGLTIDHLCRHKLCGNPDHMQLVTLSDNISRMTRYTKRRWICRNGHVVSGMNAGYTQRCRRGKHYKERVCLECARSRVAKARAGQRLKAVA